MIYKIMGDFNADNFERIFVKLGEFYKIIYYEGVLYIALSTYKLKEDAEICIKKTLKPARNFVIKEIDETNLKNESDFVIEWCRDNFVEIERQKYEIEKQNKLRATMKALDNFEQILAEQQKAKKSQKTDNTIKEGRK